MSRGTQRTARSRKWKSGLPGAASRYLCFQPGCHSLKALTPASVPRLKYYQPSVAEGLRDALWQVVLLSAETLLMLFAAALAFQRYDVR